MKTPNWKTTTIGNAAAFVCAHLRARGIETTLVGGACVSIYSDNAYESFDFDFVSDESSKRIGIALAEIGFVRNGGRHFSHPDCKYYVEFVTPPVAIGEELVKHLKRLETPYGVLNLLTPTDCVKDRLAAHLHWKDTQSLEQAILVGLNHRIEVAKVKMWLDKEGGQAVFARFAAELAGRRKKMRKTAALDGRAKRGNKSKFLKAMAKVPKASPDPKDRF